jgi:hypothetical protein
MARLTKKQRADLAEEKQAFTRVAGLAAQRGYTLHRMIGLHPYGLLTAGREPGFQGTLEEIESWLTTEGRLLCPRTFYTDLNVLFCKGIA